MEHDALEINGISMAFSRQARAKRAQSLRESTGLSRRAFAKKYDIPTSTLQNWEDYNGNGLTEKGAHKLVGLLKTEGILCSTEWLLYGTGKPPQIGKNIDKNQIVNNEETLLEQDKHTLFILEELALFCQHYPHTAISFVVEDDAMLPRFEVGEYVAGTRYYGLELEKLPGLACIVQLASGEILLRTIKKSDLPGHYTLICSNTQTKHSRPILYDQKLVSAAPVLWARRRLPGF